jgi:ribosomal protein S16
MLIIRFQPIGRKHNKQYRVVVAEKQKAVSKNVTEILGWYNPYTKASKLDTERVNYYVEKNIEMSESVISFFRKQGIIK